MTCEFPGCVALAPPRRRRCAVHAREQGRPCDACFGHGTRGYVGDVLGPCDTCGGTGLSDDRRRAPRRLERSEPVDARGLIRASEDS